MEYIEMAPNDYDLISDFESIDETNEEAYYGQDNLGKGKLKKALKKVGKGALAVGTGGLSLAASKKGRAKIKKGLKKVGGFLKKLNPLFLPIMPLRPMMRKALAKKGKDPGKKADTSVLVKTFYNEVVAKKGKYEEIHFDDELDADNIVSEAIGGIVKGVLEFIKGLKKKKASGEPLDATEKLIVDGTELAETKITESAKEGAATEIGKRILFDRKTQLIIGAVIIGIIAIVWYIRRKK